MKKFFTIASAFVALCALASSCQEELKYVKGGADLVDCMEVYFPEDQAISAEVSITPSSSKSLTIVAKRVNTENEAKVPVEIESATPEYFSVEGTLDFAAGSADASVVVKISENMPLDQSFSCSIKVTDPKYVPMYKPSASYHDFSIIIENYDLIGTGKFSDSFEGIEDYPMTLYKKHGENVYRLAEWPYTELFEYYAEKNEYDAISEMKEVSARYIYFSLDGSKVIFETWPVEYYDADAGQVIKAFWPTDISESLAANCDYSMLNPSRTAIQFAPYYYVKGLGGWGVKPATFVLDDGYSIPAE